MSATHLRRDGAGRPAGLIALAGNPNSGKTTLFNEITGAHQHVGNYPGVTVEKKEGTRTHRGVDLQIVDLPGTYSLTAFTIEERVAREFVVEERPRVVVDVADATNLERSLYLTLQFMELGASVVLALNMSDMARERGIAVDVDRLGTLLGVPVVPTVGHRGQGVEALLDAVVETLEAKPSRQTVVTYGVELEEELGKIVEALEAWPARPTGYDLRWLALKLLEHDAVVRESVAALPQSQAVLDAVEASSQHLRTVFGAEPDLVVADQRYGFIAGLYRECVSSGPPRRVLMSDRIDRVVCSPVLGLPIFGLVMFLLFELTFTVADVPVEWLEQLKEVLSEQVAGLWGADSDAPLRSLVVGGIIEGVGNVLVFLPNILMLFLAISILEDSGYMARAAFVMERVMNRVGLHGKSFIPLLLGFGCTVPAIMATRVLESRRDRLTTILVLPLMSCSARIPIYALFAGAFFPVAARGWVTWSMYGVGVVFAILAANLLRRTLFRGETMPLVMELPPYRVPTFKGMLIHTWERGRLFVRKAGTVIFAATVILWAITSYPKPRTYSKDYPALIADAEARQSAADAARWRAERATETVQYSVAGRIGRGLAVVMRPLGFDWKVSTALIGGLVAKELFVSQLAVIYSLAEDQEGDQAATNLAEVLRTETHPPGHPRAGSRVYTPLKAYTIMLFCLLSAPCASTIAVTRRETGKWRWAALQLAGLTALAYLASAVTYQVGSWLGIGLA